MRMPFGRYRGRDVADLPADYCRWLLATVTFRFEALRRAVEARAAGTGPDAASPDEYDFDPDAPAAVDHTRIVRAWYRSMVMTHHPDRGGSHDVMVAINDAHERLQALFADAAASAFK